MTSGKKMKMNNASKAAKRPGVSQAAASLDTVKSDSVCEALFMPERASQKNSATQEYFVQGNGVVLFNPVANPSESGVVKGPAGSPPLTTGLISAGHLCSRLRVASPGRVFGPGTGGSAGRSSVISSRSPEPFDNPLSPSKSPARDGARRCSPDRGEAPCHMPGALLQHWCCP